MPRRSPLYSRFAARRAKWCYFRVVDVKNGTEVARDCSSAAIVGYFRAWTTPPGGGSVAYQFNDDMTKTTNPDGTDGAVTAGSTGWFKILVEFPTDCGQVTCEVVLADTGTARTSGSIQTVSGYLEEQIEDEWQAVVLPSVTRT